MIIFRIGDEKKKKGAISAGERDIPSLAHVEVYSMLLSYVPDLWGSVRTYIHH